MPFQLGVQFLRFKPERIEKRNVLEEESLIIQMKLFVFDRKAILKSWKKDNRNKQANKQNI